MSREEDIKKIWENIKQERRPDDVDFELYPYLNCTSDYCKTRSHRDRYFSAITRPAESSWNPKITVWNSGSFPAWTCYVEVLENPGGVLKAQTIITLQPGEKRDVILGVTTGQEWTSLLGVCYDPILDPLEPGDPSGRKVTPLALILTMGRGIFLVERSDYVIRSRLNPE